MSDDKTTTKAVSAAIHQANQKTGFFRDDKDYAIEFGRYLATAAERYMSAVNDYVLSGRPASVDGMSDCWRGLQSAVHEFRKRADRATGKSA